MKNNFYAVVLDKFTGSADKLYDCRVCIEGKIKRGKIKIIKTKCYVLIKDYAEEWTEIDSDRVWNLLDATIVAYITIYSFLIIRIISVII